TAPTADVDARVDPELLRISAVSPWVQPDGVFQVRFTLAASVPLDAEITWTVHQRLTGGRVTTLRQRVDRALDGGPLGRVLRAPTTQAIGELGDAATGLSIDIPIRSSRNGSDRLLLPSPGAYPVELVLLSPDGPELWRRTLLLNRLASASPTTAFGGPLTVRSTLLLPLQSGPALTTSGTAAFSRTETDRLVAAGSLLQSVPDAPFALAVRPNTLSGLERVDRPWARSLLEELRSQQHAARPLGLPYVRISSGGLASENAATVISQQIDLGRRVTAQVTRQGVNGTTWLLDNTLTTAALGTLAASGIDAVVANPEHVRARGAAERNALRSRPLPIEGATGMRIMTTDPDLSRRLVADGATPAVRAHQVVSGMMAAWFSAADLPESQRTDPASVVVVDPATEATVLRNLVPALTAGGPITAAPEQPLVPAIVAKRRGAATLVPTTSADQGAAVLGAIGSDQRMASYRSMVGTADPDLNLWNLQNAQTLSLGSSTSRRTEMHQSIERAIARKVARISPPPDRAIVLTSRQSTIPLRYSNGLPFPVQVRVRIRAPRLEIDGGRTRIVRLVPGNNLVDIGVTSRAPGQSLLRIETSSPDGRLRLTPTSIPVRSSTISGVGAAISLLALMFLLMWWVSASRRRRRHAARSTGHHPTSGPGSPPPNPTSTAEVPATGTVDRRG
ncbi:MAG: DUF6049 family protein, partial [Actinomycetes bacterium]